MIKINGKSVLLGLFIIIVGCGVNPEKYMSDIVKQTYIDMPEDDFNKKFPQAELVALEQNWHVYRISKRTYHDLHGWRMDYRYFYFRDKKLHQIDKGQRAVDYRIQID